jgi:hypothetical protein
MISHKDCAHPSTSKDRTACRKQRADYQGEVRSLKKQLKEHQARAPRGKGKRRAQLEAEIAANAKRTEEEIHASRVLSGRLDCHVCGKMATWHDGQTGEPACSKHVTFLSKEKIR